MVSVSARACSWISLCMKCLWPPFSAITGDQSTWRTGRSIGFPCASLSAIRSRVTSAKSPSSRKITLRVWARIAGTSEATKFSPCPNPTTRGEAFLAATTVPGARSEITASAYVPRTRATAPRTAATSDGRFFSPPACSSRSSSSAIRWAKISVSVSEEKRCPRAVSSAFSSRWFSMMPLCTTATPAYWCGWAFSSEGLPCVAQRVCPMPAGPARPLAL